MKVLLINVMFITLLTACNSNEKLVEYDLYGTVITIEENTIILDTSSWSHEQGLIPKEQESGTSHDIKMEKGTKIIYENGDKGDLENIHEKQKLGILQGDNDKAETITILNPE